MSKNLSDKKPIKRLTKGINKSSGRNSQGRITVRHRGGGHKRKYRHIDFKRLKEDVPAKVEAIEYDPNRSAHIARVVYKDGERNYILAPHNIEVGEEIVTSENAPLKTGNRILLKNVPVGMEVFNVELEPNKGGQMARSAGCSLQVLANEEGYTHLKMASGEVRKIIWDCWATLGQVSNPQHNTRDLGKAGRSRWLGRRPTVRGYAMGAHDHKYGGGEGRQPRGTRRPKDIFGNVTGGKKTRKKNKPSDKHIIKRRNE